MLRGLAFALAMTIALTAQAGDLAPGVSQRVIRINLVHGEGVRPRTLEDCLEGEECLDHLTRVLNQSGGNPGLLRKGETAVAQVVGARHRFEFAPAAGERFCAAELLKPSMAPPFLSRAPEMSLDISALGARIDVAMPQNAARSWFDAFLILYGAKPGAGRACTLTDHAVRHQCKGRCDGMRF
jgi:hypothetical protein